MVPNPTHVNKGKERKTIRKHRLYANGGHKKIIKITKYGSFEENQLKKKTSSHKCLIS